MPAPGARPARRPFCGPNGRGLASKGYLIEAFGQPCVDDEEELPDSADVIEHRLGIGGLCPLVPADWNEDTFYGLVEVFHDLVSLGDGSITIQHVRLAPIRVPRSARAEFCTDGNSTR
ncbi:hypothetical protein GCM10022226_74010 [Sphaerisporangium flaviroseum]|uniref:Uncharacterized protein n=1 Tax=Sphaerisporangium flaviroseum TaxID=509199 RepID=A0ABP7JCQ4_9ACTN